MRNRFACLGILACAALFAAGCAGPEQKFGRGLSNMGEIVRGNEMNRSVEQGGIFYGTDVGMTTGFVQGFNRTMARTGVGLYEVITAPFPPYGPVCTNYLSAKPAYPDSYRPSQWSGSTFGTDHSLGFSGGDVAPWFPGSRFRIFDE